jgi:hypothetical protein
VPASAPPACAASRWDQTTDAPQMMMRRHDKLFIIFQCRGGGDASRRTCTALVPPELHFLTHNLKPLRCPCKGGVRWIESTPTHGDPPQESQWPPAALRRDSQHQTPHPRPLPPEPRSTTRSTHHRPGITPHALPLRLPSASNASRRSNPSAPCQKAGCVALALRRPLAALQHRGPLAKQHEAPARAS